MTTTKKPKKINEIRIRGEAAAALGPKLAAYAKAQNLQMAAAAAHLLTVALRGAK